MGTLNKQLQATLVLATLCASCGQTTVRSVSQAGTTDDAPGASTTNDEGDDGPAGDPRESNTVPATPPADARVYYVSSSLGNDANTGLSDTQPLKSISKGLGLLRKGFPDELLLRRGDDFDTGITLSGSTLGGRSTTQRMILGAYGNSPKRPRIKAGSNNDGIRAFNGTINNFAIVGIFFHAQTRDPNAAGEYQGKAGSNTGLNWYAGTNDLVIEDCEFRAFGFGMIIQPVGGDNKRIKNVKIRYNLILDSYSANGARHSEGGYYYYVQGLTLDGNLFDHNGWIDSDATIFNHNVYAKETNENVVIRNNIFARASSHGLQARAGGIVENNLFLANPIHLSFGHINGSPARAGGVVGHVTGNVGLGSNSIDGSPRGSGVEIGNIRANSGVRVADNIFSDDSGQKNGDAISLPEPHDIENPNDYVGVNDLVIEQNIVHNWSNAYGKAVSKSKNIVVRDNDFNTFPQNTATNRSIATYDGSLENFLAKARTQNARNFDDKYAATSVIRYIREGFGLK